MPARRGLDQSDHFHVITRGADRQDLFFDDDDRHLFLDLLAEVTDDHRITLVAYALMSNHVHLLVGVESGDDLSDGVRRVLSRYARRFNAKYERTGPLVENRFTAVPITDDPQYLQEARYIHRNPAAFLPIGQLADYPWSSLPAYLDRVPTPTWLDSSGVLAAYDGPDDYLDHIVTPQATDRLPFGSRDPLIGTSLGELDTAVAAATGEPVERLRRRGRSIGRMLAVALALELRCAPPPEVADHYGFSRPDAARRAARRGRAAVSTDRRLEALRSTVLGFLPT